VSDRPDLTTVARRGDAEQAIRGSRFLAAVARCVDVAAAEAFVAAERVAHPSAHHVCYARRVAGALRFDDDGEPGGTAGRPMAEVLERRGLDHVVGTVVRYFGGTKLGAGGLVRAYGGTLARALDAAGVAVLPPRIELDVAAPFAASSALFSLLDEGADLVRGEVAYRADGVVVSLSLPERELGRFERLLRDATRGGARVLASRSLPQLKGR
jgi:putative IMPACT (imprinted ancient) family translation regulator